MGKFVGGSRGKLSMWNISVSNDAKVNDLHSRSYYCHSEILLRDGRGNAN